MDYLENSQDHAELATFGMMRANTLLLLQLLWRRPRYTYKQPPKKTFGTLLLIRRHREEHYARPVAVTRDRVGRESGEKKEGVMNSYGSEGPATSEITIFDNVFNELEIPINTQEELEEQLKDGEKWKELVNKAYRKKALLYHPDKHHDKAAAKLKGDARLIWVPSSDGDPNIREKILRSLTSEEAALLFRRANDARDLLNDMSKIKALGKRHLLRSNASSSSSSSSGNPPPPWEIHWSAQYKISYFWNSKTGDSSWEKPTGVSSHQSVSAKRYEGKYPSGQHMFQNQLKRSLSSGPQPTCMATKAEKDKFEVSLRTAEEVVNIYLCKGKENPYGPLAADKEKRAARRVKAEVQKQLPRENQDESVDWGTDVDADDSAQEDSDDWAPEDADDSAQEDSDDSAPEDADD